MNDWQKTRFAQNMVSSMFNTVSGKKIAILGFAFKKDTGDTRETPAIDVCNKLLEENAMLSVFDPKVTREQMYLDLGKEKMDKMQIEDDPYLCCAGAPAIDVCNKLLEDNPYLCCAGAHAIAVMTEWDVFKKLDLQKIYDAMQKPAFIFDGRDVIDHETARKIGFEVR